LESKISKIKKDFQDQLSIATSLDNFPITITDSYQNRITKKIPVQTSSSFRSPLKTNELSAEEKFSSHLRTEESKMIHLPMGTPILNNLFSGGKRSYYK